MQHNVMTFHLLHYIYFIYHKNLAHAVMMDIDQIEMK